MGGDDEGVPAGTYDAYAIHIHIRYNYICGKYTINIEPLPKVITCKPKPYTHTPFLFHPSPTPDVRRVSDL